MPEITAEHLTRHLYAEIIAEISRDQAELPANAVKSAVGKVKSYLSKYDLDKLFSSEVDDENLIDMVIDVAGWRLVKLANPNVNMELFKTLHDDAIAWFREIQSGKADPQGWPYKEDNPATPYVENSSMGWSSNRKRNQHF